MRLFRAEFKADPATIITALMALAVIGLAWLVNAEQSAYAWETHTLRVKEGIANLRSDLLDIDSGQRGFLLTGDDRYLEPYRRGISGLETAAAALKQATADNPKQQDALAALAPILAQKTAVAAQGLSLYRSGQHAEGIALFQQGRGFVLMEQAGEILDRMNTEEDVLLAIRQARQESAAARLPIFVISVLLLVVMLSVYSAYQSQMRGKEIEAAHDVLTLEVEQREKVEAQLRQVQKVEAVGQLTGGVAHDFNNMLAVIISALNILQRRLDRGERDVANFVKAALDSAQRAATLTQRLLAFSRQQALEPASIDINKLVAGMSDLLRRSIGEIIKVETVLAGGLWRTEVDPNQLENCVLNLVVNARDAMPDGGKLTIETGNASLDENYALANFGVQAGQYVLLSVSDEGGGMPPDVLAKAFDPFFTTKGAGRGTGLGLSQVYGFVKQSGGHVKIYSELNQGSTVKIYLLRDMSSQPVPDKKAAVVPTLPLGGATELILVVEDDDKVRRLTVEVLRDLGYPVIHASGGAQALTLLEAHPAVVLLFTDVVMPDMNGRQLADEAKRRWPDLKLLYTTGYTRNAIVHNGMLDPGVRIIGKPFTLEQLARMIRQVLDS